MKYGLLILMLTGCLKLYGQQIYGTVNDKSSHQPLANAIIMLGRFETHTNATGVFQVGRPANGDTLHVYHTGYTSAAILVDNKTTTLKIELEPAAVQLNQVNITGNRDFKQDSLANRADFAKQFNYQPPKLSDAIGTNSGARPGELLTINPLTLIAVLTRKSSPQYKLKQQLISDEHEQYVDEHFNRGIVSRITGLKGDTLSSFLVQYRPTYQFVLKSTDYDMRVYIKNCYEQFAKGGFKMEDIFEGKN